MLVISQKCIWTLNCQPLITKNFEDRAERETGRRKILTSHFKTLALRPLWLVWIGSKGKSEGNIICFGDQSIFFLLAEPNVSWCQPYQHFSPSCFTFLPTYIPLFLSLLQIQLDQATFSVSGMPCTLHTDQDKGLHHRYSSNPSKNRLMCTRFPHLSPE